jgi:hypothetical protein
MANTTISPNMGLIIPTVAVDPGPDWANNVNASLTIIDGHNHANNSGVQINPDGLDINADLSFQDNNATNLRTTRFFPQGSPLSLPSDIGCLYESGVDLYYNDGSGNQIRITQGGAVTGATGTITGLPSGTAGASYSGGVFSFNAASTTYANINVASVVLSNSSPSSNQLTLQPPSSIPSSYSITLPALPGTASLLSMDTSGNIGTTMTAALADTVGVAMDATGANAVANSRTRTTGSSTVGAGGIAISSSCGNYSGNGYITNLSVTITTTGRPVWVGLIADNSGNAAMYGALANVSVATFYTVGAYIYIYNGATNIGTYGHYQTTDCFGGSGQLNSMTGVGEVQHVDTSVAGTPGTYTYTVYLANVSTGTPYCQYAYLMAYEL